ncbi:hypothetical protein ABT120_41025 [Nonomuraea angiospora]|uniref:hypothetical protein n=1 Tax=Nonomuraea angiospora TaxID=46172 RepID=UPI0033274C96
MGASAVPGETTPRAAATTTAVPIRTTEAVTDYDTYGGITGCVGNLARAMPIRPVPPILWWGIWT